MQFKGKPVGSFRDDPKWNSNRDTVDFTLDVEDDDASHPICCRVSMEALVDAARFTGIADGDKAIRQFYSFKDQILELVDRKLKAGAFEDDDTILIRSHDLNG